LILEENSSLLFRAEKGVTLWEGNLYITWISRNGDQKVTPFDLAVVMIVSTGLVAPTGRPASFN
jgi:hypothetical protein